MKKAEALIQRFIDAPFNCRGCTVPYCESPCTKLGRYEAVNCALTVAETVISQVKHTDTPLKEWLEIKEYLLNTNKL
jgi:hypothetical protein